MCSSPANGSSNKAHDEALPNETLTVTSNEIPPEELPMAGGSRHSSSPNKVHLHLFDNSGFERGRTRIVEVIWIIVSALLIESWLPGSTHRLVVLRLFGARISRGVTLKPGLRIKFPWRLEIGDDSWIGQDVWIDNLATVQIGSNVCLSQGAYVCTGSHDWRSTAFDLIVRPVKVSDCAWIAAKAVVAPGVTVGIGSVLAIGSVATSDLEPWSVYQGVPAKFVKRRLTNAHPST